MLFAVGSESKNIILGEIPSGSEPEQESGQDVAAQYIQENVNEKSYKSKEFQTFISPSRIKNIKKFREKKDITINSYDLTTQFSNRRIFDYIHKVNKNILSSLLSTNNYITCSTFENHSNQLADVFCQKRKFKLKQTEINLKFSSNNKIVTRSRNFFDKVSNATNITSDNKSTYFDFNEMLLEDKHCLTLEEIVHIRSVLTKAELESFPSEGRVKEDVEKRRVCFLCLKTRFGLLGPWGQHCRLCQKTVCVKCYSKMKIPTDQFSNIPVMLLSPEIPVSPSSVNYNFEILQRWSSNTNTINLVSSSPKIKRETKKNVESPSNFTNITAFGTIGKIKRIKERNAEPMHEILVIICHDCRMMVIQIIKNSRITRATIRNNVISRLTLDVSPIYV